jgi:LacI family transcriptional regulator
MAMALISRLLERGVRVPEDIAVVGFDDMPYARYAQMPLTTVSIPIRHMGELAASILFEQLDGRVNKRHQVLLQPSLVPRVSCP